MSTVTDIDADLRDSRRPRVLALTRPFYWSVRRELWEHRSLYIAPAVAAGVVLFGLRDRRDQPAASCISIAGPTPRRIAPRRPAYRFGGGRRHHVAALHRRRLLLPGRAAQRAPRPQHPVLEVAAGLGPDHGAGQGGHSAGGPAAGHLRGHRRRPSSSCCCQLHDRCLHGQLARQCVLDRSCRCCRWC